MNFTEEELWFLSEVLLNVLDRRAVSYDGEHHEMLHSLYVRFAEEHHKTVCNSEHHKEFVRQLLERVEKNKANDCVEDKE